MNKAFVSPWRVTLLEKNYGKLKKFLHMTFDFLTQIL